MTASIVQRRSRHADGAKSARVRRYRRNRSKRGTVIAVNLAPMIDMSFLLLIFFLVTTTFERAEGLLSSKLPKDAGGASAVALPLTPIVVRLEKTGIAATPCSIRIDRFENVPQSFGELSAYLARILQQPGFDNQTPVVIMAGDDVAWDHVVDCWNAAVRAGCRKLIFGQRQP